MKYRKNWKKKFIEERKMRESKEIEMKKETGRRGETKNN